MPGFGFSSLILVVTKALAPSVGNRLHTMQQAAYTEPLMLLAILSHSDRPQQAYQYSFTIKNLCLRLPIKHPWLVTFVSCCGLFGFWHHIVWKVGTNGMDRTCSSEMWVPLHKITKEGHNMNIYYHTTLKFLTSVSSNLPKALFPEYIFKGCWRGKEVV